MKHNYLRLLLIAVLLALCSCAAGGVVAYASADGDVHVRSDGNVVLAWGSGSGTAGAFGKATGIEFMIPYQVQEGFIYVKAKSPKFEEQLPIGSPLPAFAKAVFRPGEAEELGFVFVGDPSGPPNPTPGQ